MTRVGYLDVNSHSVGNRQWTTHVRTREGPEVPNISTLNFSNLLCTVSQTPGFLHAGYILIIVTDPVHRYWIPSCEWTQLHRPAKSPFTHEFLFGCQHICTLIVLCTDQPNYKVQEVKTAQRRSYSILLRVSSGLPINDSSTSTTMSLRSRSLQFQNFDVTFPDERVVQVTLKRPQKLNSIDLATSREIAEIWEHFDRDESLWVGIITGTGRAFCTGADLHGGLSHCPFPPVLPLDEG